MDPNDLHLASYRRHLRALNRSPKMIDDYLHRIGQLAKAHPGVDVTELDHDQLSNYFVGMLERQEAASVAIHFRTTAATLLSAAGLDPEAGKAAEAFTETFQSAHINSVAAHPKRSRPSELLTTSAK